MADLRRFSIPLLASLALGIGATTTVFSVVYGALIAPYPYRGAERMVQLRLYGQSGYRNYLLLSAAQFAEFQKLDVLDGAVAMDNWDMASTGDELPEAVRTGHLSAGAFTYFGVPPIAGRTFSAAEQAVVLSYPFWQRRYAGSRAALGKQLQLDHRDYTIIGVLPPRFRWGNSDVYKPLAVTADPERIYIVDARLKPGVSLERAEAAMQPLMEQFARETPRHFPPAFHVHLAWLTGIAAGKLRSTLWLLLVAVGVLLAVGCANVSILLLARGTARVHEFAVRAALGASRRRLVTQLLFESLRLSLAGGAAGVLLAAAGVKAVAAWLPPGTFRPEAAIQLNLPVLVFSSAVAVATGIGAGISPALHFSASQLHDLMRAGSQRTTAGGRSRRMRDLLVAGQVALTILLLAAAGSAIRRFADLYHTPLGYDPRHVLTVGLSLPDGNYTTYAPRAAFYSGIHKRVAALPGVVSAAVALFPIPPGEDVRQGIEILGRPAEKGFGVDVQQTTGEYFAALRIPIFEGRTWSEAENGRAAQVAVINQEMARRFWPNGSAIGQRFRMPGFRPLTVWTVAAGDSAGWLEIVGVAGNTPNRGLSEAISPAVYVPYTLMMSDSMQLVLRTAGAPLAMVRAVREQIRAVDAGQPVGKAQTAEELLREQGWAREQFTASLFLVFAMLALALAATGLYSVVAYTTALRSREFGIRMALGAQRTHVVALVLGAAAKTVGAGAVVGLALSIASGFRDALTLGVVVVLLLGAAAIAALMPACRAANRTSVPGWG